MLLIHLFFKSFEVVQGFAHFLKLLFPEKQNPWIVSLWCITLSSFLLCTHSFKSQMDH